MYDIGSLTAGLFTTNTTRSEYLSNNFWLLLSHPQSRRTKNRLCMQRSKKESWGKHEIFRHRWEEESRISINSFCIRFDETKKEDKMCLFFFYRTSSESKTAESNSINSYIWECTHQIFFLSSKLHHRHRFAKSSLEPTPSYRHVIIRSLHRETTSLREGDPRSRDSELGEEPQVP